MTDHVVVDVEIAQTIEETPGGWDATDKLGVACACLWEHKTKRMQIYGPNDVEELRERLLRADRITGFNIWQFDFLVIWGISKADWEKTWTTDSHGEGIDCVRYALRPKTDDILLRIWKALGLNPFKFDKYTHGGWGLDAVANATLGVGKIGNGADAPKWFQAGEWARVANYCADDVALGRDLGDFIEAHGYVCNHQRDSIQYRKHASKVTIPPWKPGDVFS